MTDFTKPVQVQMFGEWIDAKVKGVMRSGEAFMIWTEDGKDSWIVRSPESIHVRNTAPDIAPRTREKTLRKMTDFTKPVQVYRDGVWINANVVRVMADGDAILIWVHNIHESYAVFSNDSEVVRNTPPVPALVPWTHEETLRHWHDAFRERAKPKNLRRLYLAAGVLELSGFLLSPEKMLLWCEWSATPWDDASWQPCGKAAT